MTIHIPNGTVVVEANQRSSAILRNLLDSDWWRAIHQAGDEPLVSAVMDGPRPLVYLLDFRETSEQYEARFLAEMPTAIKSGEIPSGLWWMTGNNYRLTSKDQGSTDR